MDALALYPAEQDLGPQPGPQEAFLSCSADIAIYGGAAGGGKTYGLLLEPCRHIDNSAFGAVIFRRQAIQVKSEGGLYDTSFNIYPHIGGVPRLSPYPSWTFESGANISFNHITTDADLLSWQGSQIPFIGFDELTHFTQRQFLYMMSRNRSVSSIRPYIRATTNPDVDSWVAKLIDWWIGDDGFAIQERSGIVRWFVTLDDKIVWADAPGELVERFPQLIPKSLSFIPSKLTDNKILMDADPGYLANLMNLPRVDRERLLNGNWKVRWESGSYFPRAKANVISAIPSDVKQWVRKWDLAATIPSELNPSPDATACVLMGRQENGRIVVAHGMNVRENAHIVREMIKNIANQDKATYCTRIGRSTMANPPYAPGFVTVVPIDPGQAGKAQAESLIAYLSGHVVKGERETGPKHVRAEPLSSQWCAGNVDIVAGLWNDDYLNEMEAFPDAIHDDYVDASSGAFLELNSKAAAMTRWQALAR